MQKKKDFALEGDTDALQSSRQEKKNRKKDYLCVKHTLYPEGGVGAQIS